MQAKSVREMKELERLSKKELIKEIKNLRDNVLTFGKKESIRSGRDDILNYLPIGYYLVTVDGLLLDYNREFCRIIGLTLKKDHNGLNLPDLLDDPIDKKKFLAQIIDKGVVKNFESKLYTAQRKLLVVQLYAVLVKDEQNKPLYIEGTILDITDKKKRENELTKQRQNLEKLVRNRTRNLEMKNKELERFNKLFVDREFRIRELKEKIKQLEGRS